MSITITKEQAFKSIDALATVDEKTVAWAKPSYSNQGDQIYVGSSRRVARAFGTLAGGLLGYNLVHQNLAIIAERIVAAITSDVAANKDATVLHDQSKRVSNAVNGLRLMRGVHYNTRDEHEYLDQAIRTLGRAAEALHQRASGIELGQQQMAAAQAVVGQILANVVEKK